MQFTFFLHKNVSSKQGTFLKRKGLLLLFFMNNNKLEVNRFNVISLLEKVGNHAINLKSILISYFINYFYFTDYLLVSNGLPPTTNA